MTDFDRRVGLGPLDKPVYPGCPDVDVCIMVAKLAAVLELRGASVPEATTTDERAVSAAARLPLLPGDSARAVSPDGSWTIAVSPETPEASVKSDGVAMDVVWTLCKEYDAPGDPATRAPETALTTEKIADRTSKDAAEPSTGSVELGERLAGLKTASECDAMVV